MVEIVRGKEVTIRFDASLCVHSRNCVLSHPEVFVPNVKGEWIYPDAASVDMVARRMVVGRADAGVADLTVYDGFLREVGAS